MGLTSLPTLTDESLGRLKIETAVPDLDRWIAGAEYNRFRQALVNLAQTIGLQDGTTQGSLESRLPSRERIYVFDDLDVVNASARFSTAFGGAGADAGVVDPSDALVQSKGFGWVYLDVTASGNSAILVQTGGVFLPPGSDPVMRARVKLPTSAIARWQVTVGLSNDGASCFARVQTKTDGTWELQIQTPVPESDSIVLPGVTAVAGSIYEIEIRVVAEAVIAVTINGVSYTYSGAAQFLGSHPATAPFVLLNWVSSTGGMAYVDWVELQGTRL